jgi:hypothetical protein
MLVNSSCHYISIWGSLEKNRSGEPKIKDCWMKLLFSFAVLLAFIPLAAAQQPQSGSSPAVILATDMDCVVAIDDKVVGRVQKDHKELFPAPEGTHTASAATDAGDYWEQKVEIGSALQVPLTVSFAKVRSDRAALVQSVSALRKEVGEKEKALASVNKPNEVTLVNPMLQSSRRHSIVEAVNYYTDRWGKEMGMRDSRNDSSESLSNTLSTQAIQNAANTDTTSQAATEVAMGVEFLVYRHLKAKAHRNELAGTAASIRMQYLGKALEDPLKYPPDSADIGYLAIVQDVRRNKASGKLTTAPDRIEYSDPSISVHLSCSSLLGASGAKQLHLVYAEQQSGAPRPQKKSLVIKAVSKSDGEMLLANVYLACPKLTE